MKINKYWVLRNDFNAKTITFSPATKEQFDECTIWYKGKIPPLVFNGRKVKGLSIWDYRTFYRGINTALTLLDLYDKHDWLSGSVCKYQIITLSKSTVSWGCRKFTRKDLEEIKGAMEFHWPSLKKGE